MFEEGQEIYHCGNYFIPLLLKGDGARREEIASIKVDEVSFDGPIAVLDIKENEYRDLKTLALPRELPVSPEALRLNFRDYWRAIKDLHYDLLFPELWWEGSTMPLGDRFSKNFAKGLGIIRTTETGLEAEALKERGAARESQNIRTSHFGFGSCERRLVPSSRRRDSLPKSART
jgi:hypothetical protein